MSKVGKQAIKIPEGVEVLIEGNKVVVKGKNGTLEKKIGSEIGIKKEGDEIKLEAKSQSRMARALHGLFRTLVANMIEGVTKGYEKKLELQGVGYRAALEGGKLKLTVGFSHPVIVEAKEGIKIEVEGNNLIKVSGADKQLVGQVAAGIRDIRPPEVYKGKGIRYQGEVVKLKPGKAAKTGAAGE